MSSLQQIYEKSIQENERNLLFWENYLTELKSLDFDVYSDELSIPVLVPIGKRILFRGELKHTNEITVALGSNYFAKCSAKQAEVLRQHRIKDAQSKVDTLNKEKEYIENQVSFSRNNIFQSEGKEIIEEYTEDEDKAWREKHRENLRKYKQEAKKLEKIEEGITDDDLWNRLEELELQEELEDELQDHNDSQPTNNNIFESFSAKEEGNTKKDPVFLETKEDNSLDLTKIMTEQNIKSESYKEITENIPKETSKLDLLQQVIDRQNELGNKLFELKNKEVHQSKTENELISKLDELEQLDDLEDEMYRLDDIIETEGVEELSEEEESIQSSVAGRRVSFANNDDSNTLGLTFNHSNVEPDTTPYNIDNGIQKPSDIYSAHANLFGVSTSILKKTKYEENKSTKQTETKLKSNENYLQKDFVDNKTNEIIVINDVKERISDTDTKIEKKERPVSLFKKRRIKNKP